jgi:hypothetical protein
MTGVITGFESTGIDDNASSTSITLLGSGTVGVGGTGSSYGKLTITQSTDASTGGLGIVDSGNALSARLFSTGTEITLNAGNTGTGKLVLNAGGGNVGIGTTSPSTKLHVDGGGSSPEIRIAQNSTYYTDIGINHIDVAGNDLRFLFDGNEKGRYTNEGVLGLGVIPGAWSANYPALHVGQGATFTGHISNTQTQLGQNWWIGTGNQYIVDGAAARLIMNPDSTIIFSQAPSGTAGASMSTTHNRLVIDPNGNVGIGTSSPSFGAGGFGLELAGAAGRPTIRIKDTVTSNALQLSATATAAILESRSSGMSLVLGTSGVEKFRIDDSSGYLVSQHQSQVRLVLGSVGNSNNNSSNWIRGNASYLQYNSAASGHTWEIAGAERMRIHSSGKVLINATDPQDDPSMLRVVNSMSNLGGMCIGKVHNSTNNNNAAVLLHRMGQGQGFQFSGKFITNSWTGNRNIDCHITAYYSNDSVSVNSNHVNQAGVPATTVRLCTVNIGGVLYLAFVKNGGGTGVSFLNAFVTGNIDSQGGIREVLTVGSGYTVTTTHHTF